MREPLLHSTALRYAANDLAPPEAAAFEARLADDQDARDALAEAVRLSAAAVGQRPPEPDPAVRAASRARLALAAQRFRPLAWAGLGAAALAGCALAGLALADRAAGPPAPAAVAPAEAPPPREAVAGQIDPAPLADDTRTVAELWAEMSGTESVERAHEEEMRWRQKVRDLTAPMHAAAAKTATADSPNP